jgi:hypothetical protein
VTNDPALAGSIEAYLRFCDAAHGAAQAAARLPLAGPVATKIVRRGSDALVRLAERAGRISGIRSGLLQGANS